MKKRLDDSSVCCLFNEIADGAKHIVRICDVTPMVEKCLKMDDEELL